MAELLTVEMIKPLVRQSLGGWWWRRRALKQLEAARLRLMGTWPNNRDDCFDQLWQGCRFMGKDPNRLGFSTNLLFEIWEDLHATPAETREHFLALGVVLAFLISNDPLARLIATLNFDLVAYLKDWSGYSPPVRIQDP